MEQSTRNILSTSQLYGAIQDISLIDYDCVMAVTQIGVNQIIGEYILSNPTEFAILAIANDSGNITQLTDDPAQANCYLKGTIAPEKNERGEYIKIVDLKSEKGNQTISYNITIQNGVFHYDVAGITCNIKQNDNESWIFKMFVKLSMQDALISDLPDAIKKELTNVDENIFSIQQLYLDLNTAALNEISGTVFPDIMETPAINMLKLHLSLQQKTNKPLLGVVIKFRSVTVIPPTLTPTYIDFCVTSYHDAQGRYSNSNLDTLNYLVMTNHHQAPPYRPESFSFNWIDDENIHGALAIKRQSFTDVVITELTPILKTLCPVMYCKAEIEAQDIRLNPGVDHNFNREYNAATGRIAWYSWTTENSSYSKHDFWGNSTEASGKYSMSCEVFIKENIIKICGSIVAKANITKYHGNVYSIDMPNTTYSWWVELKLEMDAVTNGQLNIKINNSEFDKEPQVESHHKSWLDMLALIGGVMTTYTNNLGDIRGQIKDNIEDNIVPMLSNILKSGPHFILPGVKTFSFKDPQFSNSGELVMHVTYLNPNN